MSNRLSRRNLLGRLVAPARPRLPGSSALKRPRNRLRAQPMTGPVFGLLPRTFSRPTRRLARSTGLIPLDALIDADARWKRSVTASCMPKGRFGWRRQRLLLTSDTQVNQSSNGRRQRAVRRPGSRSGYDANGVGWAPNLREPVWYQRLIWDAAVSSPPDRAHVPFSHRTSPPKKKTCWSTSTWESG